MIERRATLGMRGWQEDEDPGENWRARGACRGCDPMLFFPRRGDNALWAKAVCSTCPVQTECLLFALRHMNLCQEAVYGGTTVRERRNILRALGYFRDPSKKKEATQ